MADLSQFKEAAAAVRHSPHAVSAWEEVEGLAADLDKPDAIVELINDALGQALEPEVAEMIGERAGAFCDEWFGDDPSVLEKILIQVVKLAPGSDTALQRLSVLYTTTERWNDVLALYDAAIDNAKDKQRRVRLLREAAELAKDVANKPEKAIGYYQRLLPLVPEDLVISQSLERLLERHERWAELIKLWEGRLDGQSKKEREKSRARIAAVFLDALHDPARALGAAKPLLAVAEDDTEACSLLERIIDSKDATRQVRDNALDLLRGHYDAGNRPREVIRVLERAIVLYGQTDPRESRELREEAGTRLAELDDLPAAMEQYSALLAIDPSSSVTEEKLRQLAERGNHHDRYADGVAIAARAATDPTRRVELLGEAARTRLERLSDTEGAIKLLVEASQISGAAETEQLAIMRKLAVLYAQTNRPKERLLILERQAHLEVNEAARSAILSEAAKLAESLGDTDRALSLWEQRIDSDPNDLSGLDARIAILENQQRWDDLVSALETRASKVASPNQKRADLVRVALVHHQQRKDLDAAIGAWQRVVTDHQDDEEGISALADLLAETNRWKEMADLLESASGRATHRTVSRLVRLGDALRAHLDQPARALTAYRNAIAIDPANKEARAGLTILLDVAATRASAADALAQAMRITNDVTGVLDLLPARLAEAKDDRTKLALLREAAQLRLEHKHDAPGALADLAKAFPLAPRDQLIENQILSLAKSTGDYATAAKSYEEAIANLGNDTREAARLRLAVADVVADHLTDPPRAAEAYAQVAAAEPGNRRAVQAFANFGSALARWDDAAGIVIRHAAIREAFDDELLSILELAAKQAGAHDALAVAIAQSLERSKLPSSVAALYHQRLALIHRDQRMDKLTAVKALRKALELGGERAAWLVDLVALERDGAQATAGLLDALRRLADADAKDLDSLVGAADVASKLGEREQALSILSAVLGRATAAWRGTTAIRSARSVDAVAKWAIDALVDLYRTGGRARAAVDTLIEAARLPFDAGTRRDMRLRAAQLATVELGDNSAAIDMYRSVLAQAPNDLEVIERLAHLLGVEDRVPELLTLRQIQLGLETDQDKKLTLRLELARLVGIVEERGGRLDALKANLEDRPGHEASIDAVAGLLASKGQHKMLADLLEQQALRLEADADVARAAKLWARFAGVAEKDTKEIERAISGHRKVVALAPTSDSLRALARLNLERSQPAQAVPWLESLLGTVHGTERLMVVSQLAKAHLSAHQPERAIAAIEGNLDDKEAAIELRTMLAGLYRESEQWEPLARHLTRSLPLLKDPAGATEAGDKLAREFAREASSIYLHRLNSPAKAIPALETALALDPSDKELRSALATGQRVAGRLPEARAALVELINDFGRRRSPERAALHVELARVAQAEGKLDEAMSEMESASKMDASNAAIQKELAEMARTAGQLDKAERTYRALLLVVRRTPPGDDEAAVGQSEVLFELHKLAQQRGGGESEHQAKELLESAIEASITSDAEVRRLRRSLIQHNEGELLLKVLGKRLATNPEPASQARLLGDMAETLDSQLGRGNEALDALIKAIGAMPSRVDLHDRARELAKRTDQTKRFVDAVEQVVDRLRRKDDPPLIAGLLMRAGEALEQDANDLRGAANLYRRVEILGEQLAEAFYAQARVAAALGDTAEQARTLDKMFELAGTDVEPTAAQIDALYRLAEIFLTSEARRRQGFDLLERAFEAEPRWAQAGRLLKIAAANEPNDEKVLVMYERVARNGGDNELLLDFLERRAASPSATAQQIKEAVDVAVDQGQEQRAEALLVRAVAAARESVDGLATAPWAVIALAERRLAAGDLTQARDLTYEIAPIAETETVDGLAMRIATRALAHRKIDLAADVYEFLRERSPAERAVWQPLLTIYRELGDGDRLSSVISSTLPALITAGERNALRLEHARFLIENLKRHHDALDVLRDALSDDPDNLEAAELFEGTLRALGDDDGIAEFLWSRFDDAQRRGNRDSTVDVALRLGDLLEKTGSPDIGRVYRAALIVAPDDREILRRVVAGLHDGDHNPREGAVLMERLLAVETPERAPELAGRLATMWEAAGDVKGVQRTLELAQRSAPDDPAIHDRLEKWYRDHELWAELADLMTRDAERLTDDKAVERLREAASVYSGFLGQPLKAAEVLRKARQRAPHVPELVTDHAAALAAAGELDAAQRAIGEALTTVQGGGRTALLLLRSNFRQQLGDDASAVSDLTEAYELDKERVSETLVNGLERLRVRAERDGDLPTERAATLKLAKLLVEHGDLERGRAFLVGWIERDPRDAEPLYQLCDLDESIQHWDGVAAGATRLAYIAEGESQVNAALRAATAATAAGRPAEALPVLELVHQAQPAVEILRDRLREAYEAAGEFRQLAAILTADADHGTDPAARYANYRRAAELLLYHLGDPAGAQSPAQKALELQPDDHAALMLNVDVLIASHQLEDAGRTLEAAIAAQKKRTPELAVLQQRMGRVSAMLGDKDNQLNWLKKAFDVDRKNAEVAAELAQLATEIGDYELALKPLRAITLMDNPMPVTRPMALLWEAKIEHARGNRAKAELWAKKALREDPAFADAQQFLDELGTT